MDRLNALRAPVLIAACTIFCAAVVARVIFAVFFPGSGGDTGSYLLTAENLVTNFCVSTSNPATGNCVPHWGGNQPPGYPAFIAFVWWTLGESELAVRLAQALCAAASIVRLMWVSRLLFRHSSASILLALFVAFSPLTVPWSRFLLTESLAISATIWVFAELIGSIAERKLRIIPVALASILAIFLRYDAVLLAIPIAICGIYIHGPLAAVRRGTILALLVALPLCLWIARNISVGISPLPPYFVTADKDHTLTGYVRWAMTWEVDQYDLPKWWWPAAKMSYSRITLPDESFRSEDERRRVGALLNVLAREFENRPMPPAIDATFGELADEKRSANPLRAWLKLPLDRAANLWLTPYYSFGWPGEIGEDRGQALAQHRERGILRGSYAAIREHPQVLAKIIPSTYRYAIFSLFVLILTTIILQKSRISPPIQILFFSSAAYSIARTLFFSYFYLHETRYIVPALATMEICVGLVGAAYIGEKIMNRAARSRRFSSMVNPL